MKNTICRECGGNCKPSKGLMNYHNIRTNDKSKEFTTVLEDCLKCEDCGHSFRPEKKQLTTREQAIQWWESLGSASKTRLVDTNTELLMKGIDRRWENLTEREIEKIWRKEIKTENIYLNKLKEQYKESLGGSLDDRHYRRNKYNAVRLFCLDTQLVSFNDIELMEFEVNQSFV